LRLYFRRTLLIKGPAVIEQSGYTDACKQINKRIPTLICFHLNGYSFAPSMVGVRQMAKYSGCPEFLMVLEPTTAPAQPAEFGSGY